METESMRSEPGAVMSPDWLSLKESEKTRVFTLTDEMAAWFSRRYRFLTLEEAHCAALEALEKAMARYKKAKKGPWPYRARMGLPSPVPACRGSTEATTLDTLRGVPRAQQQQSGV